jgi:hypothetical protein
MCSFPNQWFQQAARRSTAEGGCAHLGRGG